MSSYSKELKDKILRFLRSERTHNNNAYSIYELMKLFNKSRVIINFILKDLESENEITQSKSSEDNYRKNWYYALLKGELNDK